METTKEFVTKTQKDWRSKIKIKILSGGVVNYVLQEDEDRTHIVPITRKNISFSRKVAEVPSEMFFIVSTGNGAIYPDLDGFIDLLVAQQVVRSLVQKGYNPEFIKRILEV